jgi:hypothetical protein
MHYNIERVSSLKHVIIFLNYHLSMWLLTLNDQCPAMKSLASSFFFLLLLMFYIHTRNVSSTNDSHVVMLTSVEQLTILTICLMQDFLLSTSVELMMICLFLLGECFDADDDNGRICGSITPDTVLYTFFRGKIIK